MNKILSFLVFFTLIGMSVAMMAAGRPSEAYGGDESVVDSFGRTVKIPESIARIGCMYAFAGHVVAMLGKADAIVAVSNGLKRDVMLATMFPAIDKALVPKFQGAVNIEELAKTKPDIVFTGPDMGRNEAEAAKFEACGLTWLGIDFRGIEEQQKVITLIGKTLGASEKAESYNRYYRNCIARVQAAVASVAGDKRVRVYHATVEPGRTSPANSLPAEWIRAAGAINVTSLDPARILDGSHQVGIEQILLWNPEVILANEPGVADFIKQSPKWAPISAVAGGRVYQLPIGISRWGHPGSLETPLAILWTAKVLYPDRLRDLDMEQELKHFYRDYFNYSPSEDEVGQILEGKGMRLTKDRKRKQ